MTPISVTHSIVSTDYSRNDTMVLYSYAQLYVHMEATIVVRDNMPTPHDQDLKEHKSAKMRHRAPRHFGVGLSPG